MMEAGTHYDSRWNRRTMCWLCFGLFLFATILHKAFVDLNYDQVISTWKSGYQARDQAAKQKMEIIFKALSEKKRAIRRAKGNWPLTRQEILDAIGEKSQSPAIQWLTSAGVDFKYTDPAGGGVGLFMQTRTGLSATWANAPSPIRPQPYIAIEPVRRLLPTLLIVLWLLFAPLMFIKHRTSRLVADVWLATALLLAWSWLFAPNYTITLQGISSNDNLVLVVPMILVSVTGLYLSNRRRDRLVSQNSTSHCLSCGYNLTGNVSGVCPECGKQIV